MEFDEIAEDIATSSASFTDIRRNGYIYVDKTDLIYQLACKRDCCVFTRPRCFGKTLLCSTLVELFKHGVEPYDGNLQIFTPLKKPSLDPTIMPCLSKAQAGTLREQVS